MPYETERSERKGKSSIAGAIGGIRRSIGGDLQGSQERATGAKAPSSCPHPGSMGGKEGKSDY